MKTTRRPGSTRCTTRAGTVMALDASMTASKGTSGRSSSVEVSPRPHPRANSSPGPATPARWTSTPSAPGELRGQQADGAGADDEQSLAGRDGGGLDGAQRVATGLDHRARGVVDVVGQAQERAGRDTELLGERAGVAAADADLGPVLAHVVAPAEAASARSAAEHGVARDAAADPAVLARRRRRP